MFWQAFRPLALTPVTQSGPGDGHATYEKDQVQDHHPPWDPDIQQGGYCEEQEAGQRVGKEQGPQIYHTEVGGQDAGLAGGDHEAGLGNDGPADDLQHLSDVLPRDVTIEADVVRRHKGREADDGIEASEGQKSEETS